jgi:hypothetical protein
MTLAFDITSSAWGKACSIAKIVLGAPTLATKPTSPAPGSTSSPCPASWGRASPARRQASVCPPAGIAYGGRSASHSFLTWRTFPPSLRSYDMAPVPKSCPSRCRRLRSGPAVTRKMRKVHAKCSKMQNAPGKICTRSYTPAFVRVDSMSTLRSPGSPPRFHTPCRLSITHKMVCAWCRPATRSPGGSLDWPHRARCVSPNTPSGI